MNKFSNVTFTKASLTHKDSIFKWLDEPHVKEFWDNNQQYRDNIIIFMNDRKTKSTYFNGIFDYWVGAKNGEPFSLLMTSEILSTPDLPSAWNNHISKTGKTFSVDFMIGNTKFLGKGLAAPTLKAFTHFIQQSVN